MHYRTMEFNGKPVTQSDEREYCIINKIAAGNSRTKSNAPGGSFSRGTHFTRTNVRRPEMSQIEPNGVWLSHAKSMSRMRAMKGVGSVGAFSFSASSIARRLESVSM